MNKKRDTTTEQRILNSATALFLEKGYSGTTTIDIANLSGVNHSMLHYYYRTKLQLFKVVFKQQVQNLAASVNIPISGYSNFEDFLSEVLRKHFFFMAEHPLVIRFIINEINNNKVAKEVWAESVKEVFQPTLEKLMGVFCVEFSKRGIAAESVLQFLITLLSLNLFVFLADPLIRKVLNNRNINHEDFLEKRIEENVRIAKLLLVQQV